MQTLIQSFAVSADLIAGKPAPTVLCRSIIWAQRAMHHKNTRGSPNQTEPPNTVLTENGMLPTRAE